MNKYFSFLDRMSIKEQSVFARRLSFLIRAQVPLLESLTILRSQARTSSRRILFDHIIHDVANGQFLSASLAKFQRVFGDFAINIIRVGEEGGMLDQNLLYLADELQKKQALQRKIIGAMIYPIFIAFATIGMTGLITISIFPKILPIFKTLNVPLPITTRILMALSSFLILHGLALALTLIVLIGIGLFTYLYVPRIRLFSDRALLRIPLFGQLIRSYHLSNTCRTSGILLKSHFSIVRTSQITADTMPNAAYRRELSALTEEIRRGRPIASCLATQPDLFPSMVSELVAIGEKTGSLSDTFLYLATYYENEVDDLTKNLSGALEPLLMVFMGVIVGFVALSVITPIYAITQNLHH